MNNPEPGIRNLHSDDSELFREAKQLAYRLADLIGEELNAFEAKRRPLANGVFVTRMNGELVFDFEQKNW